jgi:hypothetical protein
MFDIVECRVPGLPLRSHIELGAGGAWLTLSCAEASHAYTHVAQSARARNISGGRLDETEIHASLSSSPTVKDAAPNLP